MVVSIGETDRDLACTQLAQKLRVYNIIQFKHYKFKTTQYFKIFYSVYSL
jgi:hypothetical protein